MKAFVGLDLSLQSAGIAVITADQSAFYHSFGEKLPKKPGNYAIIKRYIGITQKIIDILKDVPIQCVALENYGFGGQGLAVQCELGGIVKSQIFLALRQVPVTLPANTIRKLLLGHAKKEDIKEKVRSKLIELGYPEPDNFDQSDALAVAHVVRSLYSNRAPTLYEKKALADLAEQKFRG